ncbi:hypothetical protein A7981_04765 [Methylovorus sp. MM2]|uniref:O-linked N-acetylglucosamine transferase, SPINDLY family protein n=1 Tax=Methylovorus sp. MM2 TaxID=1848038 RepID=UPI0007E034C7|nr:tetratricopeptide repeat protein [Methylovorus sp. MM2]OAM52764.1 hypothetical protein A7981_04765 [Methylovorus sp. MM2]
MLQALLNKKDFLAVERYCLTEIANGSEAFDIWFYLAIAYQEQGRADAALTSLQNILKQTSQNPNVHSLHAAILCSLEHYDEALEASLCVCRLTQNAPNSILNAAAICQQAGKFEQAIEFYHQALSIRPLDISANLHLATTLVLAGRYPEAQKHCLSILQQFPQVAEIYNVLAESYLQMGDWNKSLAMCDSGLGLDNRFAFLWFKRGLLLAYMERFDEAIDAMDRAEALQHDVATAYFSSQYINKHDKPLLESSLNVRLIFLEMAYIGLGKCDWRMWYQYPKVLTDYIRSASVEEISRTLAFRVFNRPVPSYLRLNLMKRISESVSAKAQALGVEPYTYHSANKTQLRIGYLSADFYQHPTSVLSRQIYRLHDRLKFKIYAYSLIAKGSEDIYQKEIASNCDVFRDVSNISAVDIANLIHQDEIDILVDLGEYATSDGKLEILALRPAPIQINYLAFMATTGADFIDYALVDHYISPEDKNADWSERLLRLPNSLYTYDNEIDNSPTSLYRKDYGLPEVGIVFCCFNNDYKIEPEIFAVWMNILRAVPSSVLWLLGSNQDVCTNLGNEAVKSGIDESRLIFAGRESIEKHVKRYQLADIFLDTYWFNGHTTTLEALWQGLPVLTRCGDVTSSRVAASFLNVLGLSELVTHTYKDYQNKAIYYANHHDERLALKAKLRVGRQSSPLFNTALTLKHIELAYEMVWSRYTNNLKLDHIDVPAIPVLNW